MSLDNEEEEDGPDLDETIADEGPAAFDPGTHYTGGQLEEWADKLLREDANRELCKQCLKKDPSATPYGDETGHVEWMPQYNKAGEPELDTEGDLLYVAYPELLCPSGHRWYLGEGPRRDIRGKNPILFEPHLYNRKRRELLAKEGVVDPAYTMDRWGKRPTVGLYGRCVDSHTEALTPSGWKTYDQLSLGDSIWSYDIHLDHCLWQPLEDIYFKEYHGLVQVLESQNISAKVTPGHRWAVVTEMNKLRRFEVKSALEIPSRVARDCVTGRMLPANLPSLLMPRHYIILPRSPLPDSRDSRIDLFELLGWVLSDGTYRSGKNDVFIYQALHNPKMMYLNECLESNGLKTEPSYVDQNNVARWLIPAATGRLLREITPIKTVASIPLDKFTPDEYRSLLRGVTFGDGSLRVQKTTGYVSKTITTTQSTEADAIQALGTIVGHPTKKIHDYRFDHLADDHYTISLKKSPFAYVRPALQEPEEYSGIVWCPTVVSGFWVARRNGTVYVTGNSHPLGRRVNSLKKRKSHGAGFYA